MASSEGPRRCPVCGDEMVVVVAKTRGAHAWRGWHCRRCGHEERERVAPAGRKEVR